MKMINYRDNIIYGGKVRPMGEPFELKRDEDVNILKKVGSEVFAGMYAEGFGPADEVAELDEENRKEELVNPRISVRTGISVPTLNDLNHLDRDRLKAMAETAGLEVNPKWNNKNMASQIHKHLIKSATR